MAKIKIEHINYNNRLDERGIEGVKHLPSGGISDFNTLCGDFSDSFFEYSEGLPDCEACISIAKNVYASITKKELSLL